MLFKMNNKDPPIRLHYNNLSFEVFVSILRTSDRLKKG